ncbi:hypothetical protein ACFL3D_05670, partial [Candidatus Omnitrophota bacterium]
MKNYHNHLDILPFPSDLNTSNVLDKSDYKRKESFIDYLLKHYITEQKQKNTNIFEDEVYTKLKSDIDNISSIVVSLESKLKEFQDEENEQGRDNLETLRKHLDTLYNGLESKVSAYMKKVNLLMEQRLDNVIILPKRASLNIFRFTD